MDKKFNAKNNILTLLLVSAALFVIFIFVWCFFVNDKIRFSHKSGFYDEEFDLRIWTKPGLELHYTMDGTEPALSSPVYDGPIRITDATDNQNVYSMRTDTSVFFLPENPNGRVYAAPDYNVDKCSVIRAAAFDKKGNMVSEGFVSYWVDFDSKKGYDGLYIVSMVTDPDNLFDYEEGIYVRGKVFDEYEASLNGQPVSFKGLTPANYKISGEDTERDTHVTIFSPEKAQVLDSDAGFRIKGMASRRNNQKSFKIYAREEYCDTNNFQTSIFGYSGGMHKLILYAGGQDQFFKVDDWLISSVVSDSNLTIPTLKMVPAALFLDGEYWGTYYLMEEISGDYIENNYGVDADNVIVMKWKDIIHGIEGDKETYYDNVYEFVRQYGADEYLFDFICTYYVDIDNFIDYFATQIYIGNTDWPGINAACWRARQTGDAMYLDGKWRWILYDVNAAAALSDPYVSHMETTMERDALFDAFMRNPVFQERFYDKLDELEKEVFSWENVSGYLDEWKRDMGEPTDKSNRRFAGPDSETDIDKRIAQIKFFCENRGPEVKRQYFAVLDKLK